MRGTLWIIMLIILAGLVSADSIFLSDYMEEGQTKVYETEDGVYVINLLSVSDSQEKAVFRLNDEMSKGIKLKDSYVFEDGSEIVLRDLVINEAEDGKDEGYYYFYGTGKGVLDLRNVSRYVVENNLCNFDTQCLNETKDNCCYDCGCGDEEICANNECVLIEDETTKDSEEEVQKEVKREIKVKGDLQVKDGGERKVAIVIILISFILTVSIVWWIRKRRTSIF